MLVSYLFKINYIQDIKNKRVDILSYRLNYVKELRLELAFIL